MLEILEKINFQKILQNIPYMEIIGTLALFFLMVLVKRIFQRIIRKASEKPVRENSFSSKFIHSEKKFIMRSIGVVFYLGFFAAAFFIWSTHIQNILVAIEDFYAPVARSIIILLIGFAVFKACKILTDFVIEKVTPFAEKKTSRGTQRVNTLRHVFRYGYTIVIFGVTSMMVLGAFGINLSAILATVGVASVAIGFGAQSLVKDIIGGIFILSEDQYGVGDVVAINSEGGVVEKMTLRITQLRNTEGSLITVPNGSINTVRNHTSEWSRVDYKIGVAYETDLDHAVDVLMDEAKKLSKDMPGEIDGEPEKLGVDDFGDSAITIRIWIKTRPLKQWMVRRELNRRVHKRFDAEGIEIPFPQTTLWIKEPKAEIFEKLANAKS